MNAIKSDNSKSGFVKVTQIKSKIGTKPLHRGTLNALGLRGIGRTNYFVDSRETQGMLVRVAHLVAVEYLDRTQLEKETHRRAAKLLAASGEVGGKQK
jgi:large subunit ribosomal protein L30